MRWSLVVLGVVFLAAQPGEPTPLSWKNVLSWLPTDTETLVVAPQPFSIPPITNEDEEHVPSPAEFLRLLALGRFYDFPIVYKPIVGRRVQFAVAAVLAFHSPSALGLWPYDSCAVIKFADRLGTGLEEAFVELPKEQIEGVTAYVETEVDQGSRRDRPAYITLLVARAAPDVLLVATDRISLRTLISRRNASASGRALPEDIPEWRLVDFSAEAWAIRHYRRSNAGDGNTVMLSGPREGTDPGAVGVVYNAQPQSAQQIAYYLSQSPGATRNAMLNWDWRGEGLKSRARWKSKGVVEVRAATPSEQAEYTFLLLLLGNLGYVPL
jgi:hypothetical protein